MKEWNRNIFEKITRILPKCRNSIRHHSRWLTSFVSLNNQRKCLQINVLSNLGLESCQVVVLFWVFKLLLKRKSHLWNWFIYMSAQNQSSVQRHWTDRSGQPEATLFHRQRRRDIPLHPELPENQQTSPPRWLQGTVMCKHTEYLFSRSKLTYQHWTSLKMMVCVSGAKAHWRLKYTPYW